jgi:hypothetical protein
LEAVAAVVERTHVALVVLEDIAHLFRGNLRAEVLQQNPLLRLYQIHHWR